MKQFPVSQVVARGRVTSSCVRWPTASTRDAALVALLNLHMPKGW